MKGLIKEDMLERIRLLDERANLEFEGDSRFQLVIVGGGALILRGYISRTTDDIDILGAPSRLNRLMEKYDMNGNVNAFMDYFPFNYGDRLVHLWSGEKIDVYTASLEDILIAKLCSFRAGDLADAELVAEYVDWSILDTLAHDEQELKYSILSESRYAEFLLDYKEFESRFRKCEN